jgi:hypothetical protein
VAGGGQGRTIGGSGRTEGGSESKTERTERVTADGGVALTRDPLQMRAVHSNSCDRTKQIKSTLFIVSTYTQVTDSY